MRRIIFTLVAAVILFASSSAMVLAAGNNGGYYGLREVASKANYNTGTTQTVSSTLQVIVTTFLAMLAIVFFALMLYAGIRWMTAQGNEEAVATAKKTIESAIIGLVVVLAAYALTAFIFDQLAKGKTTSVNTTPECSVFNGAESTCNSYGNCLYNATTNVCEAVGAGSWCVEVRGGKEVSCQSTLGSCTGSAQLFTDSEIIGNFVCPYTASMGCSVAPDAYSCQHIGCTWGTSGCVVDSDGP